MVDLAGMTDWELAKEMFMCLKAIKLWQVDLSSRDEDAVTDANIAIRKIKKYLDRVRDEMNRRI